MIKIVFFFLASVNVTSRVQIWLMAIFCWLKGCWLGTAHVVLFFITWQSGFEVNPSVLIGFFVVGILP